ILSRLRGDQEDRWNRIWILRGAKGSVEANRPIKAAGATRLREWEWVHFQGPSAKCLRPQKAPCGGLSGCGSLCTQCARRLQIELRGGGGVYDQLKQGA
ncbi:hypothetical protein KUCAC02_022012, partial [Chaenocephalus aceratus]